MELTCGPAQENSLGSKSSQNLWQEAVVLEVFKVREGTLSCQGWWAHLGLEPGLDFGLNPYLFIAYVVAIKASKEDGSCSPQSALMSSVGKMSTG